MESNKICNDNTQSQETWWKKCTVCVCAYVNMFIFKYVAKRVKCIKKKIDESMKSSTKLNLRIKISATFAFVFEKKNHGFVLFHQLESFNDMFKENKLNLIQLSI